MDELHIRHAALPSQVVFRRPSGGVQLLRRTELVAASDLTLVECHRLLIRAVITSEIDEAAAADRRALLNAAAGYWQLWRVSSEITERARRPFPTDPIRTLDAIHLASALAVRCKIAGVKLLSLDDRIRKAERCWVLRSNRSASRRSRLQARGEFQIHKCTNGLRLPVGAIGKQQPSGLKTRSRSVGAGLS